ncbi:MAG TPA: endonuclease/exonuclease/phosphatase family protein [Candidatus Omnitrophota bacterium]|nr:endonuclease/exonuclease/phosphatase family protein [Candidatus Omnitrophota bacterium]
MHICNPRASCLTRLISLIIVGAVCFYIGAYKDSISGFVEQYFPEVKQAVAKRVAQIQESAKPRIITITPAPDKNPEPAQDNAPEQKQPSQRDIRLASFYVNSPSDDTVASGLAYTAQIVKYFDVAAIQGIETEAVLKKIVDILKGLGLSYAYLWAGSPQNGASCFQAFLYRQDKISVLQVGKIYQTNASPFLQKPYYARFQTGRFDFTLVSVHVSRGAHEEDRRKEIKALPDLYDAIQKEFPVEQDIILLGHFNLPPEDPAWDDLKRFPTMSPLIKPPDTTNIAGTRLYDNIWFQKKYCREYTGRSGVIKFDENMFKDDDKKAGDAVSDYRPVWGDFHVTQPDDD